VQVPTGHDSQPLVLDCIPVASDAATVVAESTHWSHTRHNRTEQNRTELTLSLTQFSSPYKVRWKEIDFLLKTLVSPEREREGERERERERERESRRRGKKKPYIHTHTHSTHTHTSVLETVLHTQEKFTREEALGWLGWTRFSTRCSM